MCLEIIDKQSHLIIFTWYPLPPLQSRHYSHGTSILYLPKYLDIFLQDWDQF